MDYIFMLARPLGIVSSTDIIREHAVRLYSQTQILHITIKKLGNCDSKLNTNPYKLSTVHLLLRYISPSPFSLHSHLLGPVKGDFLRVESTSASQVPLGLDTRPCSASFQLLILTRKIMHDDPHATCSSSCCHQGCH